jgi:transposase
MELVALYKRVIGLDVHQAQITGCALNEESDGSTRIEQRQFGVFKRDRRQLATGVAGLRPEEVVMESTGIYWKSPYAALEAVGIRSKVVNARHVKNVPGRKTDVGDAHWLATLARAGLLRGSFVPPAKLRELRLIARQRQKWVGQLVSEKNRLHKVLTDSGVRLGVVVSELHGHSAQAMAKAIIAGQAPHEVLSFASRRLKASREELFDALQGELSASHHFVLDELIRHIEEIEARIARFDSRLLGELESERNILALLQTIPAVDLIGAAIRLIEIARYGFLRHRGSTRFVGGNLPRQQRVDRQPQIRPCPQGQSLCAPSALRIRSCRQSYRVGVQVEVQLAACPPRLQMRHHHHRPQNSSHHLLHAQAARSLPGLCHRL